MLSRLLRNLFVSLIILGVFYVGSVLPSSTRPSTEIFSTENVRYVPVISQEALLKRIESGQKVVFIDAREQIEFKEQRIPGAINITLRDVREHVVSLKKNPDIVIAYCLKDFRGYEVARALKSHGIENVHTMAVPGLNGWIKQGMATEGLKANQNRGKTP